MLQRRRVLCALIELLALLTVAPAQAAARSDDEVRIASAIVQGINAERAARGLAPLEWASDSYAQQRADSQPDGRTDGHGGFEASRSASAQGLGGNWYAAEVLFWGSAHGAADAVNGWMHSSGHRNLLVHPDVTKVSVGVSCRDGALHAVAHVGARSASPAGSTASSPVVTSPGGPDCVRPAPRPDPPPPPAPEPKPAPAAAPPPPAPQPEPTQEPAPTPEPEPEPSPEPTSTQTPLPGLPPDAVGEVDVVAMEAASGPPPSSGGQLTLVAFALVLAATVAVTETRRARTPA